VKRNTSTPVWNETLNLFVKDPAEAALHFRVMDFDQFDKHDLLGAGTASVKVTRRSLIACCVACPSDLQTTEILDPLKY
jgi:Ca2+-dependent lipid-binding protein